MGNSPGAFKRQALPGYHRFLHQPVNDTLRLAPVPAARSTCCTSFRCPCQRCGEGAGRQPLCGQGHTHLSRAAGPAPSSRLHPDQYNMEWRPCIPWHAGRDGTPRANVCCATAPTIPEFTRSDVPHRLCLQTIGDWRHWRHGLNCDCRPRPGHRPQARELAACGVQTGRGMCPAPLAAAVAGCRTEPGPGHAPRRHTLHRCTPGDWRFDAPAMAWRAQLKSEPTRPAAPSPPR